MGFKVGDSGDGPTSDINITPLIDVVLVLLIIFMVITPRTINELSANLPPINPPKDRPPPETVPLVVAVYDNGDVALNKKVMEQRELFDELKQRLRGREKKVASVDAHPNIAYGSVIEIMDLIRDAGAERVGLSRLKEDGPLRAEEDAGGEGGEAGGEAG